MGMLSVLVIENEPIMMSTVRRMLRGHAQVIAAHSGAEALEKLAAGDYDVVLCNLSLDGMTGRELWEIMKRDRPELTEHTVFMSGGAITTADEAFLRSVSDRLLTKPFRGDQLLAILRRFARSGRHPRRDQHE